MRVSDESREALRMLPNIRKLREEKVLLLYRSQSGKEKDGMTALMKVPAGQ